MLRASSGNDQRTATLFPFIMNIAFVFLVCVYAFIFLTEIGVNVAPLLTGAGVAGLAVGLGAQQSIRDIIAGMTIILEGVIRVGDVVNIAGFGGLVERITLRKIQLRDYNGAVYTVPYSEIKVIQNLTKDFSYYVADLRVSYDSDPDQVFQIIRTVAEQMRGEDAFKTKMLEPVEIAGVEQFDDSAMTVKVRLKTGPIQQWEVGRAFNKRIKEAFDEAGIERPVQRRVVLNKKKDAEPTAEETAQRPILPLTSGA